MLRHVLAVVVGAVLAGPPFEASSHSWYPGECCREIDCAPVVEVAKVVPAGGGAAQLHVTSKHGTVLVPEGFPVRESMDGRMHVCMGFDPFGTKDVLCLFMPPSS